MNKIVITELCFHQSQFLNIIPVWFNRISSSIIFYLIDYFEQAFLKQEKIVCRNEKCLFSINTQQSTLKILKMLARFKHFMSSFFPKHYKLSVTFRPVKLVMTSQNVFPVYITCVFIPKVLDLTPHAKIIFRPLIY